MASVELLVHLHKKMGLSLFALLSASPNTILIQNYHSLRSSDVLEATFGCSWMWEAYGYSMQNFGE
jgi:hypothetical protein